MGQYFVIANNTQKEYLCEHVFHDFGYIGGHGIKWGEITLNRFGTLQLLAILIATDTAFGERNNPSFVGDWTGDSIGMYGDYTASEQWDRIHEEYVDITAKLIKELLTLPYWKRLIDETKVGNGQTTD